ncbi:polysaccharide deacetylase family protein [bacterium]|nr:polysaccharide deacetylase family protein [bacterium]
MNPVRQALRQLMTACLPPSRWLVRGPKHSRQLALTFDDGPHPEYTPRLLETLERWHLKATFFVVGEAADKHPELIDAIAAAGHQLGNHTWTHSEPRRTTASQFLDEIERTKDWLQDRTGQPIHWVRPPKGELSVGKFSGLWQQHHRIALWNVDPKDFRMTSSANVSAWCQRYPPAAGDVFLLHDRLPWADEIIENLAMRGVFARYRAVILDEWLMEYHRAVPQWATSQSL